jgi:hypothetical protein
MRRVRLDFYTILCGKKGGVEDPYVGTYRYPVNPKGVCALNEVHLLYKGLMIVTLAHKICP